MSLKRLINNKCRCLPVHYEAKGSSVLWQIATTTSPFLGLTPTQRHIHAALELVYCGTGSLDGKPPNPQMRHTVHYVAITPPNADADAKNFNSEYPSHRDFVLRRVPRPTNRLIIIMMNVASWSVFGASLLS